jgi:hypothetical protein
MGVSKIIAYSRFPVSLSNAEGAVFVPHVLRAGLREPMSVLDIKYILYFIVVKRILLSCQKRQNCPGL